MTSFLKNLGRFSLVGLLVGLVLFLPVSSESGAAPVTASAKDRAETSIVGGGPAKNLGWQVALLRSESSAVEVHEPAEERLVCSGALISASLIATAMHCVVDPGDRGRVLAPERLSAVVGANMIAAGVELEIATIQTPLARFSPFSARSLLNDIALIKLAEPIINAQPLALIGTRPQLRPGVILDKYGYGIDARGQVPGYLKRLSTIVQNKSGCSWLIRADQSGNGSAIPGSICLGPARLRSGAVCSGDSGGPGVVYSRLGEPLLATLSSLGDCSRSGRMIESALGSPHLNSWLRMSALELAPLEPISVGARVSYRELDRRCQIGPLIGRRLSEVASELRHSGCQIRWQQRRPSSALSLRSFDGNYRRNSCYNWNRFPRRWREQRALIIDLPIFYPGTLLLPETVIPISWSICSS